MTGRRPPNAGKGRKPGSKNKVSRSFKEALLQAFNDPRLGGVDGLILWGAANHTEFYKIAARLIPTELVGPGPDGAHVVKSIVDVYVSDTPSSSRK